METAEKTPPQPAHGGHVYSMIPAWPSGPRNPDSAPTSAAAAAVAALCWVGVRPFALRHLYDKSEHINTPAEEVIGKEALVEVAIDPVKNEGRVKVAGESWKATAETALPVGTVCVVEKLDGVTLTVKQK